MFVLVLLHLEESSFSICTRLKRSPTEKTGAEHQNLERLLAQQTEPVNDESTKNKINTVF